MSPMDSELRRTLTQHASDVDETPDLWVAVEHRAQALHRRRVALAGVSGTAVVAAVVVVGFLTTGSSQADRVVVPTDPGPSGSTTTSPSPSVSPTVTSARTPVTEWPRVGAAATWVHWNAVLQSMPSQLPSGFAPLGEPTVIGTGQTDGGAIAVFVVKAGDHLVAGAVLRRMAGSAIAVHDIPADGNVPYVGVVVEAASSVGAVHDGIVVGAPTTGQIEFKLPNESAFHPVESGADPHWAAVTLGDVQPGDPVAQVRVLDGNGDIDNPAYTGPIQVGVTFPDV